MFDMISQRFVLTLAGALLLMSPAVGSAQQPKPRAAQPPAEPPAPPAKQTPAPRPAGTTPAAAKPLWSVKITKKSPITISLSSKDGSLSEIATELGKRLKLPVILTPLMQKQRITQEFEGLPLEGALRLLAPQVYVDYELSGDGAQPKPVGIYLQGARRNLRGERRFGGDFDRGQHGGRPRSDERQG
jgi:hypothetical protein